MPKSRINNVKLDELINAAGNILLNGQQLCEEAELLHNNKMYARSYALSHLAREEIAKSYMTYDVIIKVMAKQKVNWKDFDRKFRSHKAKIVNDNALTCLILKKSNSNITIPKGLFSDDNIEFTNKRKNESLYVDWQKDEFIFPNEKITESLSKRNLAIAFHKALFVTDIILNIPKLKKLSSAQILSIFPLNNMEEERSIFLKNLENTT